MGGARSGQRAGVPHGVPDGRERGGATPRRLNRTRTKHHGSRGRDHLRLPRCLLQRPNDTRVRGAEPARKPVVGESMQAPHPLQPIVRPREDLARAGR